MDVNFLYLNNLVSLKDQRGAQAAIDVVVQKQSILAVRKESCQNQMRKYCQLTPNYQALSEYRRKGRLYSPILSLLFSFLFH